MTNINLFLQTFDWKCENKQLKAALAEEKKKRKKLKEKVLY